jgi:hypothetical protein
MHAKELFFVIPSPESLDADEVCRGRLHRAGENGYTRKSFDIVTSFLDVLGAGAAVRGAVRHPAFPLRRKVFEQRFDAEVMTRKYLSVYRQLLQQPHAVTTLPDCRTVY